MVLDVYEDALAISLTLLDQLRKDIPKSVRLQCYSNMESLLKLLESILDGLRAMDKSDS